MKYEVLPESYLLDEKASDYESWSCWSEKHLDPQKIWGHGWCHIYGNRNCTWKLKDESWHLQTTAIFKYTHIDLLTNDTPYDSVSLRKAIVEVWFGSLAPFDQNKNRKDARNLGAKMHRAKLKGVA
jgi:hypothetical protein